MLDAIENPIDERRCLLGAVFFGHLDGFVDGDVGRDVREEAQLIDRKAEDIPLHQPDTLQGPVSATFLDEGIDVVPVPYHPCHQSRREVADFVWHHRLSPACTQYLLDILTGDIECIQELERCLSAL